LKTLEKDALGVENEEAKGWYLCQSLEVVQTHYKIYDSFHWLKDTPTRIRVRIFVPLGFPQKPITDEYETPVEIVVTVKPPTAQDVYIPEELSETVGEVLKSLVPLAPALPIRESDCFLFLHYPKREYDNERGSIIHKAEWLGSLEKVPLHGTTPASDNLLYIPLYQPDIETTLGEVLGGEVLHQMLVTDQVYSFVDEDGTKYHWNTSLGRRIAEGDGRETVLFCPSEQGVDLAHIRKRYPDLDEGYAMRTDISEPILFVPFKGKVQLVDGWHRLAKAVKLGVLEIPALVLTQGEADNLLLLEDNEP
jgi:hypothetical protein